MSKFKTGDKVIVIPSGYETEPKLLVHLTNYGDEELWEGKVLSVLRGKCDLKIIEYEYGDKMMPFNDKVKLKCFSLKAKNKERITCLIRKK